MSHLPSSQMLLRQVERLRKDNKEILDANNRLAERLKETTGMLGVVESVLRLTACDENAELSKEVNAELVRAGCEEPG